MNRPGILPPPLTPNHEIHCRPGQVTGNLPGPKLLFQRFTSLTVEISISSLDCACSHALDDETLENDADDDQREDCGQ